MPESVVQAVVPAISSTERISLSGGALNSLLLLLPCNPCVRLGDYGVCDSWRSVLRWVGDLVYSGVVDLAAVDSCKPGVVAWGEEHDLRWCDTAPRWDRLYGRDGWRLELLTDAVARDLREASLRYRGIAMYINVKAYRLAVLEASRRTGVPVADLGPARLSPLSFRSRSSVGALRSGLLRLAGIPGDA